MLRDANSVLYGSDALTGVISLATRRGRTRTPEVSAVGRRRHPSAPDARKPAAGGALDRFDYFADFSHFKTDNSVPNNAYRNNTFASRFGWAFGRGTDLSVDRAAYDQRLRQPERHPSCTASPTTRPRRRHATYVSASPAIADVRSLADDVACWRRWTRDISGQPFADRPAIRSVRFGLPELSRQRRHAPRRERLLGDGPGHSGLRRHLSVSPTTPARRAGASIGQTRLHLSNMLDLSGGARVEHEDGSTLFAGGTPSATTRTNGGVFAEARVDAASGIRQRRRRPRSQRGLQVGGDAAPLRRGVSARSVVHGSVRRHQADAERRHRHQGAEHFAGAVLAVHARADLRIPGRRAGAFTDWTRAQPQLRRRRRAGLLAAAARVRARRTSTTTFRI